jgi:type IV fimbrial biogenesis protein FimT
MRQPKQSGFTLWELLVTLLVAGVLLSIGVPSFREFQRNGAMIAAANQLVTTTLTARAEALKRQVPVTWCLSANPTAATPTCSAAPVANSTLGYIVWVDWDPAHVTAATGAPNFTATDGNAVVNANEQVLLRTDGLDPSATMRLSADCGYATYQPSGFTRAVGALCGSRVVRTLLYCDDRGRKPTSGNLSSARVIRIDQPGRGAVVQEIADVNTAITATLPGNGVTPTCP